MGHSTHGCGRGWKGCDQASGSREQPWQNQAAQTDHVHARKQDHAYNSYIDARQICSNPVNRSLHTVALCVISTTSSPLQSFFLWLKLASTVAPDLRDTVKHVLVIVFTSGRQYGSTRERAGNGKATSGRVVLQQEIGRR